MPEPIPATETTPPSGVPAQFTAGVVCAFVAHNAVPAAELPGLIHKVHGAFATLGQPAAAPAVERPKPAVPVKSSITDDHLVSLIDGGKFKSLKRHLARHGMTPASYREAYGLPVDYPMTCKNYSAKRADLARTMGLGKRAAAA